jgi:hypothetical protein
MSSANQQAAALLNDELPVDMDALLNQDLDAIPDLPDFVTPKEGVYRVTVESTDINKTIGDNRAIEFAYVITELMEEKGTSTGDSCKAGDKFSELYFMSTPKGADYTQKALKKLLAPVSVQMGTTKLTETIAAFAGCDVFIAIKHQKSKDFDHDGKVYGKVYKVVFPS